MHHKDKHGKKISLENKVRHPDGSLQDVLELVTTDSGEKLCLIAPPESRDNSVFLPASVLELQEPEKKEEGGDDGGGEEESDEEEEEESEGKEEEEPVKKKKTKKKKKPTPSY